VGRASREGPWRDNLRYALDRAESTRSYLVDTLGVSNDRVGYFSGVYQHVGSRFTQIGDQAAGFGTVDIAGGLPNTIGGPLTQSSFVFNPELPAYDILNLRVGVLTAGWDISAYVKNVTDERALLALDQERGTLARVGYLTNLPRTFGITARVDF
ncbi:MAG: hypothetical protein AAGE94_18040, partial [Acidobacteriota bacterium]